MVLYLVKYRIRHHAWYLVKRKDNFTLTKANKLHHIQSRVIINKVCKQN